LPWGEFLRITRKVLLVVYLRPCELFITDFRQEKAAFGGGSNWLQGFLVSMIRTLL
jgi:hypothetical protein